MRHAHTYMTDLGEVKISEGQAWLIRLAEEAAQGRRPLPQHVLDKVYSLMHDIKRVAEFKYGGTR